MLRKLLYAGNNGFSITLTTDSKHHIDLYSVDDRVTGLYLHVKESPKNIIKYTYLEKELYPYRVQY